jgi:predicted transcriptional regulator
MNRKFTNAQLNVLSKRIKEEIEKAVLTEELKAKIEKEVFRKFKVGDCYQLAEECNKLEAQIQELKNKQNLLYTEIKNNLQTAWGNYTYYYKIENLDSFVKAKITEETNKYVPTPQEIEAEILIASINGSEDFMSEIIKKFTN